MGKGKKHRETIPALTERSKVVIEGRNALKYESGGAYLQGTRLLTVDPEDPELEIFADVLLGRDRIEQLYVVLRKGEAAREIRLI